MKGQQALTWLASLLLLVAGIPAPSSAEPVTIKAEPVMLLTDIAAANPEGSAEGIAKTVANGLVLDGVVTYAFSGSTVVLRAPGIYNNSPTRTTGTLRLELWATTTPPARAAAFTGYRLAVGPTLAPLQPQFHYSDVVQTTTFLRPPDGTYWIVFVLGEFNSVSCAGSNDSFCIQDSVVTSPQQTFGNPTPPPAAPTLGGNAKVLGSRGIVSSAATLYGGFELGTASRVYILVRGNSLGTLGVTPAYLDSPRVRLYNASGGDMVSQGGLPGFNDCLASNTETDLPVVNYYAGVRGQPVDGRDSCYTAFFAAGAYTFSVTPSVAGSTSSRTSVPSSGSVLFEVSLVQ